MKKTKLIALTMVVALMLVGAGYAAWTDTLTIQTKVNTGYLDVDFVGTNSELIFPNTFMNGSVEYPQYPTNEWDKAVVNVNDVYPGAVFDVVLKMENRSTMPVKLDSKEITGHDEFFDIIITEKYFDKDGNRKWNSQVPVKGYMEMGLKFTSKDNVKQKSLYTVNVTPIFEQFNADDLDTTE